MIFSNKGAVASVREVDEDDDLALEGYYPKYWVLSSIQADRPGYSSSLLDEVCLVASAVGQSIVLCPIASGRLGQQDLLSWYERRGFKTTDDGYMVRCP